MNLISKNLFTISAISFLCLSVQSQALADDTYVCLNNGAERKVSVVYENAGKGMPCEVIYEKIDDIQSLWQSETEAGYCETQAAAFVEKQRSWGWDCAKIDS